MKVQIVDSQLNQVIKVLKTPLHRLEAKLLDVSWNLTFGLLILDYGKTNLFIGFTFETMEFICWIFLQIMNSMHYVKYKGYFCSKDHGTKCNSCLFNLFFW